LSFLNKMDSSKILRVGEKLVSFLEKLLDDGKPIYDSRVYDKVSSYIDRITLMWKEEGLEEDFKRLEKLKELYMDYLVRLSEAEELYESEHS